MKKRNLSEYHVMWLFAMFDLPVDDAEARRIYTRFRTALLKQGFMRIQYSVYARFCGSEEKAETLRRRLRQSLPPEGEVRLMTVTDRQFGKMEIFRGKKRAPTEEPPQQLMLF